MCTLAYQASPEHYLQYTEAFLLFSQDLPSGRNLGFIDSKATELSVPVGTNGRELTVIQSPTLLSSSISTGTTGAVLWKVTPLFATWLSSIDNILFKTGYLDASSTIVELGCGISGLVATATSHRVGEYVCTDQEYVLKHLRRNLGANALSSLNCKTKGKQARAKAKGPAAPRSKSEAEADDGHFPKTRTLALDWETATVTSLPSVIGASTDQLHAVIACDCIYNSYLVQPFVQTCAELCRLRPKDAEKPTICVIAQQLRSDEVFEEWLRAFIQDFNVWRVPDEYLDSDLRPDQGFVVHVGVLRDRL